MILVVTSSWKVKMEICTGLEFRETSRKSSPNLGIRRVKSSTRGGKEFFRAVNHGIKKKKKRSREEPSHCIGVPVGCFGEGLLITSACDVDVVCHVRGACGHNQGAALPPTGSRMHQIPLIPFRCPVRSTTVGIRRVFYAPRVRRMTITSGVEATLMREPWLDMHEQKLTRHLYEQKNATHHGCKTRGTLVSPRSLYWLCRRKKSNTLRISKHTRICPQTFNQHRNTDRFQHQRELPPGTGPNLL